MNVLPADIAESIGLRVGWARACLRRDVAPYGLPGLYGMHVAG
jgi:hypothetical protein